MLKVSSWKGVIRFRKRGKLLSPRYIGTFKIRARIGPVAYRLELPQELSGVHNTFHVSNMKIYLSNETLVIPLEKIQVDDQLFDGIQGQVLNSLRSVKMKSITNTRIFSQAPRHRIPQTEFQDGILLAMGDCDN
ncbi:hypothetical protein Tco_0277490 [Tanacetum coccineum]